MRTNRLMDVVALLAVATMVGCSAPKTGPDTATLSDAEVEAYEKACFRYGRHGEPGAKYTAEYCAEITRERARRLLAGKAP